jgi:hypothetical protein
MTRRKDRAMNRNGLTTRVVLLADAVVTGATGVLMLAGAALLDGWLDLPTGLLAGAGAFLVVYVAALFGIARLQRIPRAIVQAVAVLNLGWGVGCAALLMGDAISPNALGTAFVLVQIVAVVIFAAALLATIRSGEEPVAVIA